MRRSTSLRLAAPALLLAISTGTLGAQTRLIDFHEYASPTAAEYQATVGMPLRSGGLDFYETAFYNGANSRNVLGTWGTSDVTTVNRPVNVGTATTLFATTTAGVEIDIYGAGSNLVTSEFQNPFTLLSMDIAHLYSTQYAPFTLNPISLTFSGFGAGTGNAVITQAFVIPAPPLVGNFRYPVLTTIVFDGRWHDLDNVWWFQGTGSGSAHQFTNVVLATPEPGTYLLLATGLAALGLVARRRRDRA